MVLVIRNLSPLPQKIMVIDVSIALSVINLT